MNEGNLIDCFIQIVYNYATVLCYFHHFLIVCTVLNTS